MNNNATMDAAERVFQARIQKLDQMTQTTGWDGEHGVPIPDSEWKRAEQLYLLSKTIPGLPEPFVSPCGDGTIHFRWSVSSDRQFKIEFRGEEITWSRRVGDCNDEFGNSRAFQDAVQRLRT
jgi:hypothetical protein